MTAQAKGFSHCGDQVHRGGLIKGESGALKISARNKLKEQVTSVQKGRGDGADSGRGWLPPNRAAITRQAIDEMQLAFGDTVKVVIKATEVMMMK